jgi:hypothetical protein
MSERAVIEASLEGTDNVEKKANRVTKSIKGTKDEAEKAGKSGKTAAGSWKEFSKEVDGAVKGLSITSVLGGAIGGVVVAGVGLAVNALREGAAASEKFQDRTARLSRQAGVDVRGLRGAFNFLEGSILQSAEAQGDFVEQVARTTFDGDSAVKSLKGIGTVALATGRQLQDMIPVSTAIRSIGVIGDQTAALGKLRDMAERVGTVGGPRALEETIAALGPQFEHVSAKTDEARTHLLAYIATLSQGLKPEQAKKVSGDALSGIKAHAPLFKAITGIDAVGKDGKVVEENIAPIYDALKRKVQRQSKDPTTQRRLLGQLVGSEDLAGALLRTDSAAAAKLGKEAADRGKYAKEASGVVASAEGQRIARDLERERAKRTAGETVLEGSDTAGGTVNRVGRLLGAASAAPVAPGRVLAEDDPLLALTGETPTGPAGGASTSSGAEVTRLLRQMAANKPPTAKEIAAAVRETPIVILPDPNAPKGNY